MRRSDLLTRRAAELVAVARPHPVRVPVDGVDASGKTVPAGELVAPVEALGRLRRIEWYDE
jgi:hypothetical protein